MTNEVLDAAVATGTGAAVGYGAVAASGYTAAGMVGGGAGVGMAAGPVGIAFGALSGLAAYGLFRVFGDQCQKAAYYNHLNWLRCAAPETGPSQFHCLHCRQDLMPTKPAPWREWTDPSGNTSCSAGHEWHDAQPNVWA